MSKPSVLIVDDEPDIIDVLRRSLSMEGFEVYCAYDGIAALDIAENEQPDFILLDIMMPMMSGYEVCRQLKANPATRHIPVMCVTSAHSEDVRQRTKDSGAQALMVKPFTAGELVIQIKRHMAKPAAAAETPPPSDTA